jgi:hypothetical protein
MPSIHRQPGRPYWFCAFSIWNPETLTSRRVFRSTKTRDKKQALEVCRAWHKAALKARNGKLSVDAARARYQRRFHGGKRRIVTERVR